MKDYSREIAWLRRFGRLATVLNAANMASGPVVGAAKLWGGRTGELVEAVAHLTEAKSTTFWAAKTLVRAESVSSSLLTCLWERGEPIASTVWGDHLMEWRDVFGVPVCRGPRDHDDDNFSPEPAAAILERASASATSWTLGLRGDRVVILDFPKVDYIVPDIAESMIARTRKFDVCRAWLLWGPPGSGKTRVAHAVVDALCSSKIIMTGGVASMPEAWDAVEAIRPEGLIVDDLDSIHDRDELLARYDHAHSWAKIIVTTANTLTGIRGAITRAGRAADEDIVEVREPGPVVSACIAPAVAGDERSAGLLACWLRELQNRHRAGVLTDADFTEMHRRMADAGDR